MYDRLSIYFEKVTGDKLFNLEIRSWLLKVKANLIMAHLHLHNSGATRVTCKYTGLY